MTRFGHECDELYRAHRRALKKHGPAAPGYDAYNLFFGACHPFLPKTIKASHGSVLRVKLKKTVGLRELNTAMIALDEKGKDISQFQFPKNCRLLVGEEGPGLKGLDSKSYVAVSVPTQNVESLNAVVACSIAMFEYSKQHKK